MPAREEWTLSEAARLLGEPQHRLIYLCEKGVIIPDLGNAKGRGSSRRFSARNLLEFAVALKLRELTLPVGPVAAVLHVLRALETKLTQEIPGFELARSLREKAAPDLRIIVSDGRRLYFSLGGGPGDARLFGGLDFRRLASSRVKPAALRSELVPASESVAQDARALAVSSAGFGGPEGSKHARIEVNVTGIARDLPLDG